MFGISQYLLTKTVTQRPKLAKNNVLAEVCREKGKISMAVAVRAFQPRWATVGDSHKKNCVYTNEDYIKNR